MNKYEIVLKYNKSEVVYAQDKDIAIYDFKEKTDIHLRGKGCDSILEVKLLKKYTTQEWEERLQGRKKDMRVELATLFPETYKLENDKFYIKGELQTD